MTVKYMYTVTILGFDFRRSIGSPSLSGYFKSSEGLFVRFGLFAVMQDSTILVAGTKVSNNVKGVGILIQCSYFLSVTVVQS